MTTVRDFPAMRPASHEKLNY